MRTESLVVFVFVATSACSLLAPSDGELSSAWGAGGIAALGSGGHSNGAGRASGGDTAGTEPTLNGGRTSGGSDAASGGTDAAGSGPSNGSLGGATLQAGVGNDGDGGAPLSGWGGAKWSGGTSSAGSTGAGGTSAAGSGGKVGAGGTVGIGGMIITGAGGAGAGAGAGGTLTGAGAGGTAAGAGAGGTAAGAGAGGASGGAVTTAGGKLGAGGAGSGGTITGAGGAVSHCSPNPCVRGTCSEATNGYKCTCPAGWGGTTCAVGSCANMSCPSSAPCTVPQSDVVAVCYPSACVGSVGLCMAENADGSGDAIIISGRNPDFDPLSGSNWRNRAKYFGYLDNAHGGYVCVFPQLSEGGTPLVIPLNTVRTKSTGFGQSNSWPNPPTCSYP